MHYCVKFNLIVPFGKWFKKALSPILSTSHNWSVPPYVAVHQSTRVCILALLNRYPYLGVVTKLSGSQLWSGTKVTCAHATPTFLFACRLGDRSKINWHIWNIEKQWIQLGTYALSIDFQCFKCISCDDDSEISFSVKHIVIMWISQITSADFWRVPLKLPKNVWIAVVQKYHYPFFLYMVFLCTMPMSYNVKCCFVFF